MLSEIQCQPVFSPVDFHAAWVWLCRSRYRFPADADIWHLRHHQATLLPRLLRNLEQGRYRLSPMQVVSRSDGEDVVLWSAPDALVLKMLTHTLQARLPVHRACSHVKWHGGHQGAVRQAERWIAGGAYRFVCKTDIRGYYANIDKMQLLHLVSRHVGCPIVMDLLAQFLGYTVEKGGNFHTPRKGIPRSSSLSPLLAAFHLYELDCELRGRKGVRYVRYMDDLLILTRTRWQLKRAVAEMNRWFAEAGLEQHPDKTFIGRIEKGFDWLGRRFNAKGMCGMAAASLEKFAVKLRRLLEQARRCRLSSEERRHRVAGYIKRWRAAKFMPDVLSTILALGREY